MYDKINYQFYRKTNKENTGTQNMNRQNNYNNNNYRYDMSNQLNSKINYENPNDLKRKQDARKKIMLGGLIIKAGLDYLHPNDAEVLYGMLLTNKRLIKLKPDSIEQWREIGKDLRKT